MQHINRGLLALILTPLVVSFAFGMDIYIPVVSEMQQVFHTSQFLIQMTLSLFLLATGIGDIFFGPVADQFGRKNIVLISALLFIGGAIVCALATNIGILIAGRVVCAVGSCGLLVVAFAIVRDLHAGKESAQLYSWLNAAIGISPTFAPIIGGYLALFFGWRTVFWFLVALGLVVLFINLLCLKETLSPHKRQKFNRQVFVRYGIILRHPTFLRYMLFAGFGVSICFGFFSVSPFVIINILHVPQVYFGYYFAVFGLALAVGGIINGKIVYKFGVDKSIQCGIGLMFIGGILMLLGNLLFGLHLYIFLSTMAIACLGAVFFFSSGAAGAMEPFPEYAGTAAAALQAGQFIIASIIGSILMHYPVHSSISYAVCILLIALASVATLFIKKR